MFNPYELYNQNPNQSYQQRPSAVDTSDQNQRMAALLRQGYDQPNQQSKTDMSGLGALAGAIGEKMSSMGGNALPQNSQNAMTNAITPDFQSVNMQAPQMNMTGASNITPNFANMPNAQAPAMANGLNPSMFAGVF